MDELTGDIDELTGDIDELTGDIDELTVTMVGPKLIGVRSPHDFSGTFPSK